MDAEQDFPSFAVSNLTYKEHAKYLSHVFWIDGFPWVDYNRVLMPLPMPHISVDTDRAGLRKVLKQSGCLLAVWTTEWDTSQVTEWWWTCYDRQPVSVDNISDRRGRRSVRKGLRCCTVRRVHPEEYAESGFPIYCAACEQYGVSAPTLEEFREGAKRSAAYRGSEFWGAYYDEIMVAYATCVVQDDAVSLGSTKSLPDYDKYQSNAALFYSICEHYSQRGLRYITNGSRTLWHPTQINDYLQRLGFRKVYCRLNLEMSPPLAAVHKTQLLHLAGALHLEKVIGRPWHKLMGLAKLVDIAESFGDR
ncbi:MAG: GNAT family N-acetyltransferase [Actinomycetia bacterium]|nr:GNAT family N-acetyltransferase [Actinomycetes bacterium]